MRVLCQAIVVPPAAFWEEFDIPREVKNELFFGSPDSQKWLRDIPRRATTPTPGRRTG